MWCQTYKSARALAIGVGSACALALIPGGGFAGPLPDDRAYEVVSPPQKNGGDIVAEASRTRAAEDGSAIAFLSLAGFGDIVGKPIVGEYISQRSSAAQGDNGWRTHSITPVQSLIPFDALQSELEPFYVGELAPDLSAGVYSAYGPLTDDPNVANVPNLYRRSNLRAPGPGLYELVTACPLCDLLNAPLPTPPASGLTPSQTRPLVAWASPQLDHVVFQSKLSLTADVPANLSGCNPPRLSDSCPSRVYEWSDGSVRLAQILPDGRPADAAVAGQSFSETKRSPHVVSDGSDGHSRVFFTQLADATGQTASQLSGDARRQLNQGTSGNVFMRVDDAVTEQLNATETAPDDYAPATFLDASGDGTRGFFLTRQALTDDALSSNLFKLYMYDASKPGSDPHNLTLLNPEGGDVRGLAGISDDGRYAYIVALGQLVRGGPSLNGATGLFVWNDGAIRHIGQVPGDAGQVELFTSTVQLSQARVTPDGRHVVFSARTGEGLTGEDHGNCVTSLLDGCRQLYVYSADSGQLACVSCHPSGVPPTTEATIAVRRNNGGARLTWHRTRAINNSGSRVFFSTAEALVPDDTNGKIDAYQYDVPTRELHLLSSGKSTSDSWFLDASASGDDVFFLTREALVGWDRDGAYDIYDARVGGGFPEPAPPVEPCTGDACRPPASSAPGTPAASSRAFEGLGNEPGRLKRRAHRCTRRRARARGRGKAALRGSDAKSQSGRSAKRRARRKRACVRKGKRS